MGAIIAADADIDHFTFSVQDFSHLSKEAQAKMAAMCTAFWQNAARRLEIEYF